MAVDIGSTGLLARVRSAAGHRERSAGRKSRRDLVSPDLEKAGPRRPWLSSLAVAGAVVLVWEGSKALFAIPRYKLPHIHEILAEFHGRAATARPGS